MSRETVHRAALECAAALGLCTMLVAGAVAAPPPPPGGPHTLYYGGDNTAGYPQFSVTNNGDPDETALFGPLRVTCAPNPFGQQTLIQFAARVGEPVRVRIFDTRGRLVQTHTGVAARTGRQDLTWEGRDTGGVRVAPGVYFYEVRAGARTATGRLVFIR